MTLGAEVRRLRVAGGLTQRELAEPAYTRAFVAAIESGAADTALELAEHYLALGQPVRATEVIDFVPADADRPLASSDSEL